MPPRYYQPDREHDYITPYTTTRPTRSRSLDREPFFSPLDAGLDRIGDYVARRLVPVMQNRSDRPLQLVMNFGALHLASDGGGDVVGRSGSCNAVVYNAPGCVMTVGDGSGSGVAGRGHRGLLGSGVGEGGYGYGGLNGSGSVVGKKVGICHGCYKRQLVGLTGYCSDCNLGARERASGLDGIRYVRTPEWLRREERELEMERLRDRERERLRDRERDRERERRLSAGYYTDFERDDLRYGADRDGYRYVGERW